LTIFGRDHCHSVGELLHAQFNSVPRRNALIKATARTARIALLMADYEETQEYGAGYDEPAAKAGVGGLRC
jgi:hypothetical protein